MSGGETSMTGTVGILDREHRAVSIGTLLAMSLIAFDGLALVTIAPEIATDLEGFRLYGWIFSAFLLAQVLGTVGAGQLADAAGPARPLLISLMLFGVGLLLGALVPTMLLFVLARALQGLGAGALGTCVYTITNTAYPDSLRPRMLAAISSAFIVPALVGPPLAGFIAEQLSWRVVFYGLLPLLGAVWFLAMPAFREASREKGRTEGNTGGVAGTYEPNRLPAAAALAAGTALLLGGLEIRPLVVGLVVSVAGGVVSVRALGRLLPAGTLAARPGLPATIATRGLFVAGYFYTETYLVLALAELGGYRAAVAGLAVSVGALSWTGATWIAERLDKRGGVEGNRRPRVVAGVSIMVAGIAAIALPLILGGTPHLMYSLAGWVVAGLGIGLAHPTSAAVAFSRSPEGREGFVSSSILLADLFTPAVAIGVGGVLVEFGRSSAGGLQFGLAVAFGLVVALISSAAVVSLRLPGG
jgi:MFS family permease